MALYSLLREYPQLRPYWYAALALLAVIGVALILWDGKTQVAKGRRIAAKKQERQRQQQRALAGEGPAAGTTAITLDAGSEEVSEGVAGGGTQQRRPRKMVS